MRHIAAIVAIPPGGLAVALNWALFPSTLTCTSSSGSSRPTNNNLYNINAQTRCTRLSYLAWQIQSSFKSEHQRARTHTFTDIHTNIMREYEAHFA